MGGFRLSRASAQEKCSLALKIHTDLDEALFPLSTSQPDPLLGFIMKTVFAQCHISEGKVNCVHVLEVLPSRRLALRERWNLCAFNIWTPNRLDEE